MPLPSRRSAASSAAAPPGSMLGYLLASAGVDVVVLEKHPTSSGTSAATPSTRPPSICWASWACRTSSSPAARPDPDARHRDQRQSHPADRFPALPGGTRFLALMPQWDFLDFWRIRPRIPNFRLIMQAEVTDIRGSQRPRHRRHGDHTRRPDRADRSPHRRRRRAASAVRRPPAWCRGSSASPIDVLWFHLPKVGRPAAGHARLPRQPVHGDHDPARRLLAVPAC